MSEQRMSIPASSSMATRRLTMVSLAANRRAPTDMVTDSTVGKATGIAATVSTRANCRVAIMESLRNRATVRISATSITAITIR